MSTEVLEEVSIANIGSLLCDELDGKTAEWVVFFEKFATCCGASFICDDCHSEILDNQDTYYLFFHCKKCGEIISAHYYTEIIDHMDKL